MILQIIVPNVGHNNPVTHAGDPPLSALTILKSFVSTDVKTLVRYR